jgi:hypothetical protein
MIELHYLQTDMRVSVDPRQVSAIDERPDEDGGGCTVWLKNTEWGVIVKESYDEVKFKIWGSAGD